MAKEFVFDPERFYPTYFSDGAVHVQDEDGDWHIIGSVVNESSGNFEIIDTTGE